jgi:hypothetical protein
MVKEMNFEKPKWTRISAHPSLSELAGDCGVGYDRQHGRGDEEAPSGLRAWPLGIASNLYPIGSEMASRTGAWASRLLQMASIGCKEWRGAAYVHGLCLTMLTASQSKLPACFEICVRQATCKQRREVSPDRGRTGSLGRKGCLQISSPGPSNGSPTFVLDDDLEQKHWTSRAQAWAFFMIVCWKQRVPSATSSIPPLRCVLYDDPYYFRVLPPFQKTCSCDEMQLWWVCQSNYFIFDQVSSKTISIYVLKQICYENIFHNKSKGTYFIS